MTDSSTLIFLIHQVHSALIETEIPCLHGTGSDDELLPEFSPPEHSVRAVLDFASSYEVADTTSVGKVEWLLN